MLGLEAIQTTAMEVAEAITHVIGIETEIVDASLKIIAGTGRYAAKIGGYEEDGRIRQDRLYGRMLVTGEDVIVENGTDHPDYHPREGERGEISCAIVLGDRILGLVALVAFSREQHDHLLSNSAHLLLFLKKMAALLASKVKEVRQTSEIQSIFESLHDGILAIDHAGVIQSSNSRAAVLLGVPRKELEVRPLTRFWPAFPLSEILRTGIPLMDLEQAGGNGGGEDRRFLCNATPVKAEVGGETVISGVVVSFQNLSDFTSRINSLTQVEDATSFDEIIGAGPVMSQIKKKAARISASGSTLLITGESGTGKGLLARAIHNAGPRRNGPFITINCGAIPDTLLESELFGYQPGAFTGAGKGGKVGKFELAHGGTLFLDEIGDFPLHLQVKLLHVLQNREIDRIGGTRPVPVDVRIMAATNRDLEEMMRRREFREDLFFRLNVIPFHLPPLRERPDDLILLIEGALEKFNRLIGKQILGFTPEALDILLSHPWPGNIRELENVVEYAVNIEQGPFIPAVSLPQPLIAGGGRLGGPPASSRARAGTGPAATVAEDLESVAAADSLAEKTDAFQRLVLRKCLDRTGYSVSGKRRAAEELGISESTLYRRIRELGITNGPASGEALR